MKVEVEFLKKHYRYKQGDIIAVPRNMAKALESLKLVKMAETNKAESAPKSVLIKTPAAVKPPKPAKVKTEATPKKSADRKKRQAETNKAESAHAAK